MSSLSKKPWKQRFLKLPPPILSALSEIKTDLVVVAATKLVQPVDIAAGHYSHLVLPASLNEPSYTLPALTVGEYSKRNVEGWSVKRKDLPKISKTFSWETPNFGDGSTYGYHLHSRTRDVYQQEFYEPRGYKISVEKLRGTESDRAQLFKFSVDHPLYRRSPKFLEELLFAVNLLQENTGVSGVFASDASRSDYIATQVLDWEVFPPGTAEEVTKAFLRGRTSNPKTNGIVAERIKLFSKLKPQKYLRGTGGFGSYVGALYADDLVVFENVNYGNALYVLYSDWQDVSRRSRLELLQGTDSNFDRFPHLSGWDEAFEKKLKAEKKKRGIRD